MIHPTSIGPIECHAQGEGAATVALLHAAASGPRSLFKLAAALADGGGRILTPALNGYGATRLTDADLGQPFAAHVRVARWALEQAPAGRRVLVGHSMGGLVALLTVAGGAAVDAAVVYEPIVLGCLDPTDPADAAARAWDAAPVAKLQAAVASGDPEAGVAAFVEAYNEVAWSALPAPLRAQLVADAPKLVAETRAAQTVAIDFAAVPAGLPILVLQGERSPDVTHRMTLGLARRLPQARRQVIAEAGHMGPVLSAAPVAAAIREFLADMQ